MTGTPDAGQAQLPARRLWSGTGRSGANCLPAARVPASAAVEFHCAGLSFGARQLWADVDLTVGPAEFVGVLGPNGAGKSSLLRVLLGQQQLTSGRVLIAGEPPRAGSARIGYVPQNTALNSNIRARDLVRLGVDGHLWGAFTHRRTVDRIVAEQLAAVDATGYADVPVRFLSGGERQRLRVAQALAGRPDLLLCDEPLASLDAAHQHSVAALIDSGRRARDTAVVFVTHELNPVLPYLDRVIYLAPHGHRIGTVDQVLETETLSRLHGHRVEVLRTDRGVAILDAEHPAPELPAER